MSEIDVTTWYDRMIKLGENPYDEQFLVIFEVPIGRNAAEAIFQDLVNTIDELKRWTPKVTVLDDERNLVLAMHVNLPYATLKYAEDPQFIMSQTGQRVANELYRYYNSNFRQSQLPVDDTLSKDEVKT